MCACAERRAALIAAAKAAARGDVAQVKLEAASFAASAAVDARAIAGAALRAARSRLAR